jgi:hypothetical protein
MIRKRETGEQLLEALNSGIKLREILDRGHPAGSIRVDTQKKGDGWESEESSDEEEPKIHGNIGKKKAQQGYKAKYPIVIVPGTDICKKFNKRPLFVCTRGLGIPTFKLVQKTCVDEC